MAVPSSTQALSKTLDPTAETRRERLEAVYDDLLALAPAALSHKKAVLEDGAPEDKDRVSSEVLDRLGFTAGGKANLGTAYAHGSSEGSELLQTAFREMFVGLGTLLGVKTPTPEDLKRAEPVLDPLRALPNIAKATEEAEDLAVEGTSDTTEQPPASRSQRQDPPRRSLNLGGYRPDQPGGAK